MKAGHVKDADTLNEVTLRVKEGSIVTTIGPNGCGKSTLVKRIFGFSKPRDGRITFDGKEITNLGPEETLEAGLTYIPQEISVFPRMTAYKNLEMGVFARTDHAVDTVDEFIESMQFFAEEVIRQMNLS